MFHNQLLPLSGFLSVISGVAGIFYFNSEAEQSTRTQLTYSNLYRFPKKIDVQATCSATIYNPEIDSKTRRPIGDKRIENQLLSWNLDLSNELIQSDLRERQKTLQTVTVVSWKGVEEENRVRSGITIKDFSCQGIKGKDLKIPQIPPFSALITLERCDLEITEKARKCFLKVTTGEFEWNTISPEY